MQVFFNVEIVSAFLNSAPETILRRAISGLLMILIFLSSKVNLRDQDQRRVIITLKVNQKEKLA